MRHPGHDGRIESIPWWMWVLVALTGLPGAVLVLDALEARSRMYACHVCGHPVARGTPACPCCGARFGW